MFVLKEDGGLVALRPAQFVVEDDFQRLLEEYPELLAGLERDSEGPCPRNQTFVSIDDRKPTLGLHIESRTGGARNRDVGP